MSRRGTIPRRHRAFIGCEGESERGYVAWLRRTIAADRLNLHLDAVLLKPGAGDPLRMVDLACDLMRECERKRGPYRWRAVLLDADRCDEVRGGRAGIQSRACQGGLRLIWQEPNHEAMLLRHLPGCEALRPTTAAAVDAHLRRHWPAYAKPMSANDLAALLDANSLRRALRVEAELAVFLRDLGFT